jgi:hypothetical protein
MTPELSGMKCERPDCHNEVPSHRDKFCSDRCLKAYSAVETSKFRLLRTLRGYGYASHPSGRQRRAS